MARLITLYFYPSDPQLLLPKTIEGGGVTQSIPLANPYPFVFQNLARVVSFTSSDDLSGSDFVIDGTDQFGNFITETVQGPNNETVFSINQYHTVTNISAGGAYTNFSIGSGPIGTFLWIKLNTMSVYPLISVTAEILSDAEGAITYSVYTTLDDLGFYKPVGSTYTYVFPGTPIVLVSDPLHTTTGSNIVIVTVPSTAGMNTGDIVKISGATDTNGITANQINSKSMITVIDGTHFSYSASDPATSTGDGGGNSVTYTLPALPYRIALIDESDVSSESINQYMGYPALQVEVSDSAFGGGLKVNILEQGIN